MNSWPPSVQDIIDFIAFLSLKGSAPSTARSYLSGIGYQCKILQVADPTQNFVVKKLLLGMSRLGSKRDKRLPITINLLQSINTVLPSICYSQFEAALFKAAFCLAYFGFFRVGELVVDSSVKHNHALAVENVQLKDYGRVLEVFLPHAKTDQAGSGSVIALSAVDSPVCPVLAMKAFLDVRPKRQGHLFIHFSGDPVTRFQFSSILKKALTSVGVTTNAYTTHSFRIGAATSAASRGISEDGIKEFGRWESKAFKSYIRIPTIELL